MTNITSYFKKLDLEKYLNFLTKSFLFLLPWHTIWIYREVIVNGAKWEFGVLGIYATELILWLAVVVFMLWYLGKLSEIKDKIKFQLTKDRVFLISCFVFVVYVFTSYFWVYDVSLLSQHSLFVMEALLLFLIITMGPFKFKEVVFWFVAGGIVQALLAAFQFLTQTTFSSALLGVSNYPIWQSGVSVIEGREVGRWLRAYGGFPHPNILGGYLTFSLIALLSLFIGSSDHNKKQTIYFLLAFILLSIGIFSSFSRAAWFASGFTVLFAGAHVLIQSKEYATKLIKTLIMGIMPLMFLLVVFAPLVNVRVDAQSTTEVRSLTQRASGLSQALGVFNNHKFLGTGVGNYTAALMQSVPDKPGWYYQPVHNSFMLFLVEFGLVGLVIFLLVVNSYVDAFYSDRKLDADTIFMSLSVLFTILFVGSFDHYLVSTYVGIILTSLMIGFFTKYHLKTLDLKSNDS